LLTESDRISKLKSIYITTGFKVITGIIGIILFFLYVSCSSDPKQSPEDFVRAFIEKHILMIDLSLVDFYVKEEQSGIRELIHQNIQAKKDEGILEALLNAKSDLSTLRVKMINQRTLTDSEPKFFVEVEVKGFYTITINGIERTYLEDETFVLLKVGDEWKVTQKLNPWK
jgi:hypothetical protein